ncbi:hypothetical protein CHUAL_003323 [Chamberlinius hualienensis]
MVHKKSEYRLRYKWLPDNVKKEILQTSAVNLDYRVQRRQRDLWHHPWEWNAVDDPCECDEPDEGDEFLPLPPLRQKHNMLVDDWNRKAPYDGQVLSSERQEITPYSVAEQKSSSRINEPILDNKRTKHISSVGEPRLSNVLIDAPVVQRAPGIVKNEIYDTDAGMSQSARIKDYSYAQERGYLPMHMVMSDRAHEMRNPRRVRTDVVPVMPRKPPVISSRPASITKRPDVKITRKTVDKKPPFHAYGWANSVNEIGKRQTHNIRVQSQEVHPNAVLAKKIKYELSQPSLINFTQKSKSITNLANFSCPVNHGSLWTTEYQRNFSTKGP